MMPNNNFAVFQKNYDDMSSNGTKALNNSEAETRLMNYQEMSHGKFMDLTNNSQMETIINQNE